MSQGQGQASWWARPETRVSNSALLNVPEENALRGAGRGWGGEWQMEENEAATLPGAKETS